MSHCKVNKDLNDNYLLLKSSIHIQIHFFININGKYKTLLFVKISFVAKNCNNNEHRAQVKATIVLLYS